MANIPQWQIDMEVATHGKESPLYGQQTAQPKTTSQKTAPGSTTKKSTSTPKTSTLDRAKLQRAEERLKGLPKNTSYQPSSPALELRGNYSDRILREAEEQARQVQDMTKLADEIRTTTLTYEPGSGSTPTVARLGTAVGAKKPAAGFGTSGAGTTKKPTAGFTKGLGGRGVKEAGVLDKLIEYASSVQPAWNPRMQVAYGKDYGVSGLADRVEPNVDPATLVYDNADQLTQLKKLSAEKPVWAADTKIWPESEYANYYDYRIDPSGGGEYGVWRDTGRHEGIDIYPTGVVGEDYSGSFDRTTVPVIATVGGTVLHSGTIPGAETAGITTMVLGDDGRIHVYSHLNDTPFVQPGQRVSPYQELGYIGNTGRSSGPHLHYQIATSPSGEPVVVEVEGFDPGSVYGRDYITDDPTEIVKEVYGFR